MRWSWCTARWKAARPRFQSGFVDDVEDPGDREVVIGAGLGVTGGSVERGLRGGDRIQAAADLRRRFLGGTLERLGDRLPGGRGRLVRGGFFADGGILGAAADGEGQAEQEAAKRGW